MLVLELSYKS
ncbi:hypothetical protein LINPERHAP1_LOCUS9077 [Linum perenne]